MLTKKSEEKLEISFLSKLCNCNCSCSWHNTIINPAVVQGDVLGPCRGSGGVLGEQEIGDFGAEGWLMAQTAAYTEE